MDNIVPPPWDLNGTGYILVFKFSREFVSRSGFIPPYLEGSYQGGFGAVMLVDYHVSDVGPYRELLFIPGLFAQGNGKRYSITKIYVSTIESVVNGQENWGIPKELADFTINTRSDGNEHITVGRDGQTFLEATFKSNGLKIPVNSRLVPLNLSIMQRHKETTFITCPQATGWVSFARLVSAKVDSTYFPDFTAFKPLAVIHANPFKMVFPLPHTQTNEPIYEPRR